MFFPSATSGLEVNSIRLNRLKDTPGTSEEALRTRLSIPMEPSASSGRIDIQTKE
jgi:hypothetical protein